MRSVINKIALIGVIALVIYIGMVLMDVACVEALSFCRLYEPVSPW